MKKIPHCDINYIGVHPLKIRKFCVKGQDKLQDAIH